MQHDGFLIIIFLVLALVIPAVIFFRIYKTISSGARSKSSSEKAAIPPVEVAQPEQAHSPGE